MAAPALLLDLDGVIVDALQECALVTWLGAHPPRPDTPVSAHVAPPGFTEHFARIRGYARTLGHFLVAHRSDPGRIRTRADFDRAYAAIPDDDVAAFVTAATAARARCRTEEPVWWLDRHTLYPGLAGLLHRHAGTVAVITAKDAGSAWAILRRHGLAGTVTEVVGECTGKDRAIAELCRGHGGTSDTITFLDDNLTNVQQVLATGADARWATWGYHTPEDAAVAAAAGIRTIDLAGAAALTVRPGVNHREEPACPRS
jgi:phosphoglycolate phosphatase-like HAD superfamily hydrolase